MTRRALAQYPVGSFEHVVLHARWRRSRGKNPSVGFGSILNPRSALDLAERYAYFPRTGAYLDGRIPEDYVCSRCGATGCKLWRECNSFPSLLLCARCAAADQKKDISTIGPDGQRISDVSGRTDQIGWFVPAVPTEDGVGYWSYSAVPTMAAAWWRALPTHPAPAAAA